MAVVSIVSAVLFLIYGSLLLRMLHQSDRATKQARGEDSMTHTRTARRMYVRVALQDFFYLFRTRACGVIESV